MDKQILTDNQEKWLTALESGKYEQTTSALRRVYPTKTCYCVLGVAEHLFPPKRKTSDNTYRYRNIQTKITLKTISTEKRRSDEVINFINEEFDRQIPLKKHHHYVPSVFELNDRFRLTFKQIAQVVREFPEIYLEKESGFRIIC